MIKKELDWLRDKTLSFWCLLKKDRSFYAWKRARYIWLNYNLINWKEYWIIFIDDSENIVQWSIWTVEILWHPITRWRLYQLRYWKKPAYLEMWEQEYDHSKYNLFFMCFHNIEELFRNTDYSQTEIERMYTEYRDKLYPLLLEFNSYFND